MLEKIGSCCESQSMIYGSTEKYLLRENESFILNLLDLPEVFFCSINAVLQMSQNRGVMPG